MHSRYRSSQPQQIRHPLRAAASSQCSLTEEGEAATDAKRLSGAGRRTVLTAEHEAKLRAWVMEQRRGESRLVVSDKLVLDTGGAYLPAASG